MYNKIQPEKYDSEFTRINGFHRSHKKLQNDIYMNCRISFHLTLNMNSGIPCFKQEYFLKLPSSSKKVFKVVTIIKWKQLPTSTMSIKNTYVNIYVY